MFSTTDNSQLQFSPEARERMAALLDGSNECLSVLSGAVCRVCRSDMKSLDQTEEDAMTPILLAMAGLIAATRELASRSGREPQKLLGAIRCRCLTMLSAISTFCF